jgi:GNAT superfamily N-acetyltransferase
MSADLPPGYPQEYLRLVTPELLDYLTTVDYTSRLALVAVEPASQRGVAIARYEPAGQDGTADVAIAVTPGWRDVGLAGELLRMLSQAASERGIHTFTGTFFADNRPVTALISEADEPATQLTSRGITEFSAPLPPGSRALGHDHEGHRSVAGQADGDRTGHMVRGVRRTPDHDHYGLAWRGRRGCRWPPGR